MFFKVIKRGSYRARKDNGIYFVSLIISIIAFYVILSLGEQDVMIYLETIEGDAVGRFLKLLPVLYGVSLFFIFFLVYFANRYQFHQRRREYGLYLTMGMRQGKLFTIMILETLWSGLIAVLIGVPFALFLTEIINLTTSRFIGIGIIDHTFHISWVGLLLTIAGFIVVQLIAVLLLVCTINWEEPLQLLQEQKEKSQRLSSPIRSMIHLLTGVFLVLGTIFLGIAYALAVLYLRNFDYKIFALIFIIGISGTFLLFRGLGNFVSLWIRRKSRSSTGLSIFTARQLQENVLRQWGSLAIASLLMLMAIACFAFGISTAFNNHATASRTVDITLSGDEQEVNAVLRSEQIRPYVEQSYAMNVGGFRISTESTFSWLELKKWVEKEVPIEQQMTLQDILDNERPYFIALSSYNELLESNGQAPIVLGEHEVALYSDEQYTSLHKLLTPIIANRPAVEIHQTHYQLIPTIYSSNVVADKAITLSYALIVTDMLYNQIITDQTYFWNVVLNRDFVEEKGLTQAMQEVEQQLETMSISYESYLASMGRQLFYIVASSYVTFYLGVMFLIIANTVLGLKFLMQQQSTRQRYYIASMLGASTESLCASARKQIWYYFVLVISVALISSVFGIWSMVTAIPTLAFSVENSIVIFIILVVVTLFEFGYIRLIQRKSDEEIQKLKEIE